MLMHKKQLLLKNSKILTNKKENQITNEDIECKNIPEEKKDAILNEKELLKK